MGNFNTSKRRQLKFLEAPLTEKLQRKLESVEWGKYRIGDLFEQKRGKESAPNRVKDWINNMVNEISTNNGITKKAFSKNIIDWNSITVSVNYARNVFYQKDKFCASVNILVLQSSWLTEKNSFFIVSSLKRNNEKYNYGSKISKDKLNDSEISLPTKNWKIDFDFMESFVEELDKEKMEILDKYLEENNFKDCELSEEENRVLREFESGEVEWGEWKLKDLFEKLKVKSLKYKTSELPDKKEWDFILPALTAWIQNQWLNNFVPKENATILKNVISISANWANTGATFYQNKEFTVLQDAYAIDLLNKENVLNDEQYLFLTSSISKTIYWNYEWTNKAGWEKIKWNNISLPTKNGEVDYGKMEVLISGVQKLVIKRVVEYVEGKR